MGTVRNILFIAIMLLSVSILGQEEAPIAWDPDRKLTWEDFRGTPFKTAWAAATTASGISYEYTGMQNEGGYDLEFKIVTYFYPDKSWYQPKLCDEHVLSHEQLHFDISELYARKFRKLLASYRFTKNAKAEVKAIYDKVLTELSAFQSRYDHETNYSRDPEKQKAWNRMVAEALSRTPQLP